MGTSGLYQVDQSTGNNLGMWLAFEGQGWAVLQNRSLHLWDLMLSLGRECQNQVELQDTQPVNYFVWGKASTYLVTKLSETVLCNKNRIPSKLFLLICSGGSLFENKLSEKLKTFSICSL